MMAARMAEKGEKKYVLVTGGAGYIGSHTILEMIEKGTYKPVVVDNLANSSRESIRRVEKLTKSSIDFYEFDLLDIERLRELFKQYSFYGVIHFAGLKSVGESMKEPLLYYNVNIFIAINVLQVMKEFNVKNIVFSSSATVYGKPIHLPIDEDHPAGNCSNTYGKTKYFVEEILRDLSASDPTWNVILLRYFNPVGAHPSGQIGEAPNGIPNNLMPYILQVLVGKRPHLSVFGKDYDTTDGTGVRDYIHVVDLSRGHLAALKRMESGCGLRVYNLGTGKGCTVLELVAAMERASGKTIPFQIAERRAGDIAVCYADPKLAYTELGWKAELGADQFCTDAWHWQSKNPDGYAK